MPFWKRHACRRPAQLQTGKAEGMQMMDQALIDAISAKLVDPDDAYRYANDRKKFERFVMISDHYHLARVGEMCKFNGVQAITAPSRIQQPFLDLAWYRIRESMALLAYWLIGK